jgi:hypothetical protein
MIRNAMFQKVRLAARDEYATLASHESAAGALSDPPVRPVMNLAAWEEALGAYWDEYETLDDGPAARSPNLLIIDKTKPREWSVRQIINDPDANHDWAIVATVDLDASDATGEPVIRTQSFGSAS